MDNRGLLLEWAVRLFAGRGYDAVGVLEICQAARVTKPTLYHYFSSKRGLLEAVLEEGYPALLDAMRQAAVYRGDLDAALEQTGRAALRFAQEQPRFYRLHLALQAAPPEGEPCQAAAPYRLARLDLLEALFLQGVRQYGGLRGRQRPLAASFAALVDVSAAAYLDDSLPLTDSLIHQLSHQFLHGVL